MKILWIVNMLLPEVATHLGLQTSASGSWLEDLSSKVSESENIELAVAAVGGAKYQDISIGRIRYFLLPGTGKTMLFYNRGLVEYWRHVYKSFKPHIVHLHGTEYCHGLSFLRTYQDVQAVVSIQGIISRIKDVALEGIPFLTLFRCRTLKENFNLNGMIENWVLNRIAMRHEQEILNLVKYANVVNFWDMSVVKSINPSLKCFQIEYNLREPFYTAPKWDINRMERFTIFTNPGGVPLKGLHFLLRALHIVKRECPTVILRVPGMTSGKDGELATVNGYAKYIKRLIRELGLGENVQFLGRLNAVQMVEQMLKGHVVVIPSAIEGTSLMLREAMFLGVPPIASFRGGMADFIRDKESGYLYDYPEFPYLAFRILKLFGDDSLALKFSRNAIMQAEMAHDRSRNPEKYLDMYQEILSSGVNL